MIILTDFRDHVLDELFSPWFQKKSFLIEALKTFGSKTCLQTSEPIAYLKEIYKHSLKRKPKRRVLDGR